MWGNNYSGYYPMPGTNGYNYHSGNMGQAGTSGNMMGQATGQNMSSPFNWVLGQGEAESFPVSPGCTVILWDSNANIIYLKTADQTGRPSMRKLRWEEYVDTLPVSQPTINPDEYVTRKEFDELLKRLTEKGDEE